MPQLRRDSGIVKEQLVLAGIAGIWPRLANWLDAADRFETSYGSATVAAAVVRIARHIEHRNKPQQREVESCGKHTE